MSQTAIIISVAYAIAVALGTIVSFAVWASTKRADAGTIDRVAFARRESVWMVVVVLGLFALLMATIFYVPYGESAGPDKQVVRVTGVQYAWAVEPTEIVAGRPVEFWLRSEGVNGQPAVAHGFGVYSPGGKLLFQAQVVPGDTQKVVRTFRETGTYEVLCLEFCGAGHHEMTSTFEVVAA